MMRIALFLLTNLAVMVVFGLVLSLTGIQSSSMTGLLIMALLFGFGGSIVSLMMSKWMALKSVGGEVIEQPRNETERWLMNTVAQQAQQVREVAVATLGAQAVRWNQAPSMASEDFACMLEACPGAYFWIGTDGETPSKPLHNASYDFNDALIGPGVAMWVGLVEKQLPAA